MYKSAWVMSANSGAVHSNAYNLGYDAVTVEPMLQQVSNWPAYVGEELQVENTQIRIHGRTGRPAGSHEFINKLETLTGKELKKKKPGPKPGDK